MGGGFPGMYGGPGDAFPGGPGMGMGGPGMPPGQFPPGMMGPGMGGLGGMPGHPGAGGPPTDPMAQMMGGMGAMMGGMMGMMGGGMGMMGPGGMAPGGMPPGGMGGGYGLGPGGAALGGYGGGYPGGDPSMGGGFGPGLPPGGAGGYSGGMPPGGMPGGYAGGYPGGGPSMGGGFPGGVPPGGYGGSDGGFGDSDDETKPGKSSTTGGVAVGARCDAARLVKILEQFDDAAKFSSDKDTFIKTITQTFAFTSAQAAQILAKQNMDSMKGESLPLFRSSLTDPHNKEPILSVFSFSGEKDKASKALDTFEACTALDFQRIPIEDDGHRVCDEFLAKLKGESFSSKKMDMLKAEIAQYPTPPFDAHQLTAVLKAFSFAKDAAAALKLLTGPQLVYKMSCAEVLEVLGVFSMESDRLELLKAMKPFIADPQEKLSIVASFKFSGDKKKAEEILRDLVALLKPPVPPMAEIQQALRRVGRCPAGYDWRQVFGGWRCAAGGHYVSDSQLQAAMGA